MNETSSSWALLESVSESDGVVKKVVRCASGLNGVIVSRCDGGSGSFFMHDRAYDEIVVQRIIRETRRRPGVFRRVENSQLSESVDVCCYPGVLTNCLSSTLDCGYRYCLPPRGLDVRGGSN